MLTQFRPFCLLIIGLACLTVSGSGAAEPNGPVLLKKLLLGDTELSVMGMADDGGTTAPIVIQNIPVLSDAGFLFCLGVCLGIFWGAAVLMGAAMDSTASAATTGRQRLRLNRWQVFDRQQRWH